MLLTDSECGFLAAPVPAALTTIRSDGSPHVAPVRFGVDPDRHLVTVMTVRSAQKARNVLAAPRQRVALCQVDGFRWLTLEGTAVASQDRRRIEGGICRYIQRYRTLPPAPPDLIVIEVYFDRVMSLNI